LNEGMRHQRRGGRIRPASARLHFNFRRGRATPGRCRGPRSPSGAAPTTGGADAPHGPRRSKYQRPRGGSPAAPAEDPKTRFGLAVAPADAARLHPQHARHPVECTRDSAGAQAESLAEPLGLRPRARSTILARPFITAGLFTTRPSWGRATAAWAGGSTESPRKFAAAGGRLGPSTNEADPDRYASRYEHWRNVCFVVGGRARPTRLPAAAAGPLSGARVLNGWSMEHRKRSSAASWLADDTGGRRPLPIEGAHALPWL